MKDKIIGFLILGGIIIGIMWALEIGPFEKYYPPINYGGSYEPSFTGRNGPCDYGNHNCKYKCNDWREPAGGGTRCSNCGHDIMVHDPSNESY